MKLSHIFLLVLLTAIWGFNFVAVKIGLNGIPPLTFTALRFFVSVFPVICFVKKPDLPLSKIAAFGALMFAGQFAFLFSAMHAGLSAGLASLVLQMQAFFTIGFAILFLHEHPRLFQLLGTAVAALGIGVVAFHTGGEASISGLFLAICAAMSWGSGNVLMKTFGRIDAFGLIIWGSLFAFLLLAIAAWAMEDHETILRSLSEINHRMLLSLAYIVYISTFIGYTIWSRMLAEHSASQVAPFTLLVPVFGMLGSAMCLHESYPLWKFEATLLIIGGLCLNQFGGGLIRVLRNQRWRQ